MVDKLHGEIANVTITHHPALYTASCVCSSIQLQQYHDGVLQLMIVAHM